MWIWIRRVFRTTRIQGVRLIPVYQQGTVQASMSQSVRFGETTGRSVVINLYSVVIDLPVVIGVIPFV